MLFTRHYLAPLVKQHLISHISASSGGLCRASIDELNIQLLGRGISADNVSIEIDTLDQAERAAEAGKPPFLFFAGNIKINNIGLLSFFADNAWDISSIAVSEPVFNIISAQDTLSEPEASTPVSLQKRLSKLTAPYASSVRVDHFSVKNGRFLFKNSTARHKADSINIKFDDLLIDSNEESNADLFANFTIRAQNYELDLPESKTRFNVKYIISFNADSSFIFKNIKSKRYSSEGTADTNSSSFQASAISIQGLNIQKWFNGYDLVARKLAVDKPVMHLKIHSLSANNKSETHPEKLPYFLFPLARSFKIDEVKVSDGIFTNDIAGDNEQLVQQKADDIHIDLSAVAIDSSSNDNPWYSEDISIQLRNYSFASSDNTYDLQVKRVQGNVTSSRFSLEDISFKSHTRSNPRDFYNLEVKDISMTGFDYAKLIFEGDVDVNRVHMNNFIMKAWLDKNIPLTEDFDPRMPNEAVRSLPFYLKVNKITASGGYISYTEKAEGRQKPGRITFEQTNLTLSNITNDPVLMTKQKPALVYGTTKLMGQGLLTVQMRLPLLSEKFNGKVWGKIGQMEAVKLNPLLVPNERIKVRSGRVDSCKFSLSIHDGATSGNLSTMYHDLKVDLLDEEGNYSRKTLSFIANLLIRNKSEPGTAGNQTEVMYARTPDDGFIRFLWRSLRGGLAKIITRDTYKLRRTDNGEKK